MRYFYKEISFLKHYMTKRLSICFIALLLVYACSKKSESFNKASDADFDNSYCNDPIAINFNQGFPGTANNAVCIYPTDVFNGTFALRDSVYNGEYELDTVLEYMVTFHRTSFTNLRMSGFCINGDTVRLTADRYYRATVDSTLLLQDSSMMEGHIFCRYIDTIMGSVSKYPGDSNKIRINFTIASDTGINYHIGTGIK